MKMVPTRAILGKTLCIKISFFETYAYLFAYDVGLLTACSFMRLSCFLVPNLLTPWIFNCIIKNNIDRRMPSARTGENMNR